MKLQAQNAVADVHKRRSRVFRHHAAGALHVGQHQNSRPFFELLVAARRQIEILGMRASAAVGRAVERFHAGGEHALHVLRQRPLFTLHTPRRIFKAQRIP